jgi:hypothetical protein
LATAFSDRASNSARLFTTRGEGLIGRSSRTSARSQQKKTSASAAAAPPSEVVGALCGEALPDRQSELFRTLAVRPVSPVDLVVI